MTRAALNKVLYGELFVVVLPLGLIAWAHATREAIHSPVIHSRLVGAILVVGALALIIDGMFSLWHRGGGLPMNAFPPPRFVTRGIYSILPHPIYVGFVFACAGASIFFGSASGLWLVTPFGALGCAALVLGYESPDLNERFGRESRQRLLPPDGDDLPSSTERLRAYLLVLVPWLVVYEIVVALGTPVDAISTYLPFEHHIPVWQWTEIIYFSTYIVVVLTPLSLRSTSTLRSFMLRGWIAILLVFPIYWVLPFVALPRTYVATSLLGKLLHLERLADSPAASFPSFHVIWACISAATLGATRLRRIIWYIWAFLVALSCITTGSHSCLDIIFGFVTAFVIFRAKQIWNELLRLTEVVGNSWCEWRVGPLRIINHGAYAAVGTFLGMFILDTFLGRGGDLIVLTVSLSTALGAMLWAQLIEGSPSLLRPLGFYGGLLGGIVGTSVAPLVQTPIWTALAALSLAAPVVQGVGRLRCVVQGCCHGRPTHSVPGIRCNNRNSRVCRLAGLYDVEIHATPLYSLLWNAFIFVILARLVALHTRSSMICGVYLLLGGIGRFVEEAYRGEPQTVILYGLRLYQWLAIITVLIGAIITTITSAPLAPIPQPHPSSALTAFFCGMLAWFVSAIDFPNSDRRFARLT
jgi:prolipoprotein diacylglyceryltransferase/protein-S-isoprenylcysteine O-methyltransferase Ste14